jgi:hypothetical protein
MSGSRATGGGSARRTNPFYPAWLVDGRARSGVCDRAQIVEDAADAAGGLRDEVLEDLAIALAAGVFFVSELLGERARSRSANLWV